MDTAQLIPNLLLAAWLLPLASFTIIVFLGPKLGKHGVAASWIATGAIVSGCLLSLTAFLFWWQAYAGVRPATHHVAATMSAADRVASASADPANILPPRS